MPISTIHSASLNQAGDTTVCTTSGNFGVGTATPAVALEVKRSFVSSAIEELFRISRVGATALVGTNRAAALTFYDSDNPTLTAAVAGVRQQPSADYNGALAFYTNSTGASPATTVSQLTERMRINSSGNVGIGTDAPLSRLQVKAANPQIYMEDSAAGPNGKFTAIGTNNGNMTFNRYLDNGTLAGEYMRITSGGTLRLAANQLQLSSGDVGIAVVNGTGMLNAAFSFTFNVASQGSVFVFAAFNHYGLMSSYGCTRLSSCGVGTGGGSEVNIFTQSTATGGSWTFSPSVSTMTITHNAGNYNANGLYTIIVIGNSVSI